MDTFLKRAVVKVNGQQSDLVDETIITEYPFKLYVNDKEFCTFYCTPENLEELIVGNLNSRGMLSARQDIGSIEIDMKKNTAKVQLAENAPSPKQMPLVEPIVVKIQTIYEIMGKNIAPTVLFKETGGFHRVAIYDQETEIVTLMDVARHNAVDKVIGHCILNGVDCRDKLLVVSGRISSDMIEKADKGNIPIVLSKSASTTLSIEKAEQAGITLVGFVRGERMNVYTHPNRIDLGDELFGKIAKKKRIDFLKSSFKYLIS